MTKIEIWTGPPLRLVAGITMLATADAGEHPRLTDEGMNRIKDSFPCSGEYRSWDFWRRIAMIGLLVLVSAGRSRSLRTELNKHVCWLRSPPSGDPADDAWALDSDKERDELLRRLGVVVATDGPPRSWLSAGNLVDLALTLELA